MGRPLNEETRAHADREFELWYDGTFKAYEQDVKRGNAGAWCTAQLQVQGPNANVVRWNAHGKDASARFEQRGEHWVIVELSDFNVFAPEAILGLQRGPH